MTRRIVVCAVVLFALRAHAQEDAPKPSWVFRSRVELRANYRDSHHERFALRFPFQSEQLPIGQTVGFEETVDRGRHAELSVAQLKLDIDYDRLFTAHAQLHAQDMYRRNPTSEDKKIDADELYIRFGEKPELLDRPARTSFFVQVGKAPKMERQPVRLLESYGLAATSFNRFEDIQLLTGGTIGRNFYWRLQAANGNPLYFRDPNALAGDNGIKELLQPNPDPRLKSGFPILYNAEIEGYSFDTKHVQFGQGVGYRWQNDAQTLGFDGIAFHYRRSMSSGENEEKLTGTFYGGDLDLLLGPLDGGLPLKGRIKEEYGGRTYVEWHALTTIAQFTKQQVAGLQRQGYEVETGYRQPFAIGPQVDGESLFQSVQPAIRVSGITNRFRGSALLYPAPSIWWQWTKIDYGVRIGMAKNVDVTAEYAKHNVGAPRKVNLNEGLVTVRVRI